MSNAMALDSGRAVLADCVASTTSCTTDADGSPHSKPASQETLWFRSAAWP